MEKSYDELVAEEKAQVEHTSVETVHEALSSGEHITIVDVREPDEYAAERIPQARHIPRRILETQAAEQLPDKDARIITHCGGGGRGSLAAKSLREMGYANVANLEGGLNAWRERGYETASPRTALASCSSAASTSSSSILRNKGLAPVTL